MDRKERKLTEDIRKVAAEKKAVILAHNYQRYEVQLAATPEEALTMAFAQAGADDLICATGSIIFNGDLLNQWDRLQSRFLLPKV